MRHRPHRAQTTETLEWEAGTCRTRLDDLAAEEPLEIRVNGTPVSVTMRTPGDEFELAAGFLFTEGVAANQQSIQNIAYGAGPDGTVSGNVVDVTMTPPPDLERLQRLFVTASACGICGRASIAALQARDVERPGGHAPVTPELLCRLPDVLRPAQAVFSRTGGLHAAALYDVSGAPLVVREDIGRHNAVDKVIGRELLAGRVPLSDHILLVSGRGGFEIVQKAIVAGVPVLASVSAPSSLAVRLAREYGLTLVGFLRGTRFVVYAGADRIVRESVMAGPQ